MNSQISDIYSQLKRLQKNDLTDTNKYKEVYEQMRSFSQNPFSQDDDLFTAFEPEPVPESISESQISQVQQQILAYKYLIRKLALPESVENNVFSLSNDQWEIEKSRLMQRSLKFYNEKVEKDQELKKLISQKLNNSRSRAGQPAGSNATGTNAPNEQGGAAGQNQQGQSDFLNDQSVRWIEKNSYFVEKRKQDINILLSNNCIPEDSKLQLNCEMKFLENLPLYTKLKDSVLHDYRTNDTNLRVLERNFLDRSHFKREKPARKYEARMMEKFELHIKNEQENRKRTRHKEFLNQLFAHQTDFFDYHKKKAKILKKRVQHAKNYIEQAEKREQEKKDKELKERVKALKSHHFDDYLELVQKAKNQRIIELLQQTDNFLRQIGAKVKVQKGEAQDDQADGELKENADLATNLKNSNKIYYNVTHTIQEDVKEQPTLLKGGTLKNYQIVGLQWMISLYNNKLNGILADEMGLGKTIQTISLFAYLMEFKKNYGPFLVIVPLTTLSNWVMEFDKWAPSIKKIVYKGGPQVRKALGATLKNSKWNVVITTYEYILKDRLVLNKFQWQYVVIDEGHRMKNARSKFASTLGQQYTSEHRLLLTGTPLQNNLGELWSLLNFLLPKVFNSCDEFEKWFGLAVNKVTNDKEGQLNEEEQLLIINRLHQVLRPFLLRRVKKEVESEIPNKVEYIIKIELSAWQKIVYEQIKNNGSLVRDPNGKITTKALMNLMMQLRKICNHPYLFLNQDYYTNVNDDIFRTSGKFELLDRILPKLISLRHRVLIFSQMTHLMDILQIYFNYRGFRHLRLDGTTKAEDRAERMALFNKAGSEYDIFLLSTRAGGLGLNLQTADTVIIFDSDWNPQMDLQAQDRAHRIGQKSEVRVLRLVTNTWIEEEIIAKAAYKQSLDEILIQAGLYNERSTDVERRAKLEHLLKRKTDDDDGDDEIPDDEQVNEMIARSEEELVIFEKMDNERYEQEAKIYKHFRYPQKGEGKFLNYRLMQPDETPSWLISHEIKDEEIKEYGRGNRVKKQVSYVDDVSDVQWLKNFEESGEQDSVADSKSQTGTVKSNEKGSRARRTRSQKTMPQADETPQDSGRRLRRRATNMKTSDLDLVDEEDEQQGDEDFTSMNDEEDDTRFRRLKKVKKNLAKSETSGVNSESRFEDDMSKNKNGDDDEPYIEKDDKMEEESFF